MEINEGAPAQDIQPGEIRTGDDGNRYIVLANGTWFNVSKVPWVNRQRQLVEFQQNIRETARRKK